MSRRNILAAGRAERRLRSSHIALPVPFTLANILRYSRQPRTLIYLRTRELAYFDALRHGQASAIRHASQPPPTAASRQLRCWFTLDLRRRLVLKAIDAATPYDATHACRRAAITP